MQPVKTPPPASNTGVENKFLSQSIDWLEITFGRGKAVNLPSTIAQDYSECKAFNGYTVGTKYSDGRIHLVNPERPDMGQHIVWGGGALKISAVEPMELLRHVVDNGATVTRLDLAIDVFNCDLRPEHATTLIEAGLYKCRAKKYPVWKDARNNGYTQYMGTKSSEIFIRMYDKAAELGITGDHTRVELVLKQARAQMAAYEVLQSANFCKLVRGFICFPTWSAWDKVMGDIPIKLPAQQKESATKKWLLTQCAPALAKVLIEDGDDEFYFRFLDMVRAEVNDKREKVA